MSFCRVQFPKQVDISSLNRLVRSNHSPTPAGISADKSESPFLDQFTTLEHAKPSTMKLRFISHLRSRAKRSLVILVTGLSCLAFAFVFAAFSESVNPLHSKPIKVGVDTSDIHRLSSNQANNEKLSYLSYLLCRVNDWVQVMHGTGRNAMDYLDAWTDFADANNHLIVAPEFSELIKGETFDYHEGNVWDQHHVWNKPNRNHHFFSLRLCGEKIRRMEM